MVNKIKEISLYDIFGSEAVESKEYTALEMPKIEISKEIKKELKKKSLSLRKLADVITNSGSENYKISYTQIARVTSGENYKINTLLKILDALGLEIIIKSKYNK